MFLLYSCWHFPTIIEASLLKAVVEAGVMPPDADKSRGVNVPYLISRTLFSQFLFFDVFMVSVGSVKGRKACNCWV